MSKRLFDLLFGTIALLIAAPFFLFCAIAVKLSSPGPLFYAHSRVGREGRRFHCLKFRTMYLNADAKLQPLLAADPQLLQEWQTYYKLKMDPRVTPIGRFLRRTSLDELPQIWNVVRGDMSIVGPRPLTEHEVIHYLKEKAPCILSVRPGLTTLWITEGRNRFSLAERVDLEEFYVKNRSFWMDLKLIAKTVWIILFPSGAY